MTQLPMAPGMEPEQDRIITDTDVERYPWIPAWGMLCRFPQDTVRAQIIKAVKEDAPPTALSRFHTDRGWTTLEDVTETETRLWFLDYAYSRGMHLPYEVLKVWLDPVAIRFTSELEWNPWDRS